MKIENNDIGRNVFLTSISYLGEFWYYLKMRKNERKYFLLNLKLEVLGWIISFSNSCTDIPVIVDHIWRIFYESFLLRQIDYYEELYYIFYIQWEEIEILILGWIFPPQVSQFYLPSIALLKLEGNISYKDWNYWHQEEFHTLK